MAENGIKPSDQLKIFECRSSVQTLIEWNSYTSADFNDLDRSFTLFVQAFLHENSQNLNKKIDWIWRSRFEVEK